MWRRWAVRRGVTTAAHTTRRAINMHLPERWGYLQFSRAAVNTTQFAGDPTWPLRLVLRTLYYYQHAFNAITGYFTPDLTQLNGLPAFVVNGELGTLPPVVTVNVNTPYAFTATVNFAPGAGGVAANVTGHIRDDRYTWMTSNSTDAVAAEADFVAADVAAMLAR